MPRVDFAELPEHGRLWVFPLSAPLPEASAADVMGAVDTFLDGWVAHGVPLRSARTLVDDHFLLVGVDVDVELPSGCSIDALTGQLRSIGQRLGLSIVDHAPVWYRDASGIHCVPRLTFKQLAADGAVDGETTVFDTSLTRVGDAGALAVPASESWHGRAFFKAPAGS
ncbi:MAG: hypothetical protein AAF389_08785 [Gemmatimonadota bacterium]